MWFERLRKSQRRKICSWRTKKQGERESGRWFPAKHRAKASETKQNSLSRHGLHINTAAHSTGMLITVARCTFCLCNIWAVCLSYTELDMHSMKSRAVYLPENMCVCVRAHAYLCAHARVSSDLIRMYLRWCVMRRNISTGWGGGGGWWWMPPSLLEYQSGWLRRLIQGRDSSINPHGSRRV